MRCPLRCTRIESAWFALCVLSAALVAGCSHPTATGDTASSVERPTESTEAPAPPITLEVADKEAFEGLIEQYRGHVVLVDYWATWCKPCRKQFPHTVRMHQKFADQGLKVISVSLDEPASRDAAIAFLTEHGATFDNLLSAYGGSERTYTDFHIEGGVPFYQLYDRQGRLADTFFNDMSAPPFSEEDIETAVQELLVAPIAADAIEQASPVTSTNDEIELAVGDRQALDELIARHRGDVVLVDYWATWCVPCREQFPDTVRMAADYADAGLKVISVSVDDEDAHQQALEFLREQGAEFENLRSSLGAAQQAFEQFAIDGGVPFYQIYDRQGELVRTFAPGPDFDHAQIEVAVREQLDTAGPD